MKFKGHTVNNQPATNWKAIYAACRKYERFIIDVSEYNETTLISDQQRKYWHAVPVEEYARYTGHSTLQAEHILKRECGREHFFREIKENQTERGQVMFECLNPLCKKLFTRPFRTPSGIHVCPDCKEYNFEAFFMRSKTCLTIKEMNEVIYNAVDYMSSINCPIELPDPNWRKALEEEKRAVTKSAKESS